MPYGWEGNHRLPSRTLNDLVNEMSMQADAHRCFYIYICDGAQGRINAVFWVDRTSHPPSLPTVSLIVQKHLFHKSINQSISQWVSQSIYLSNNESNIKWFQQRQDTKEDPTLHFLLVPP